MERRKLKIKVRKGESEIIIRRTKQLKRLRN